MNHYKLKDFVKAEVFHNNKFSYKEFVIRMAYVDSLRCVFFYRLAQDLKTKKVRFFPGFLYRKMIRNYGCFISLNADIDIGLRLPHPTGIVIGDSVKIGKNCTIYQQVTLGGRNIGDAKEGNYPNVEDNVVIFAGAKIIGKITIGKNSVVGANSVVNRDVLPNTIVVGVPAKVLKKIN